MEIAQKLGLAASLAGALMLAACGGDSNSGDSNGSEEQGGVASVATFDDLAHCTKSHYGEIVFVEEESAYFECTSEDWAEVDESKLDSLLAAASSSSEADEDKPKSSSSVNADSSEIATVETKKVDSVTVSGFAQKGPFASGSAVTVYGLDSLLEKTKTKFTGKIAGDSGYFKIEKIALPSQFALVEVSGYYQNEITGKKTSGTKTTLSALVDLNEGKAVKANVNLFTELEYARAKNLVLKEKFNVPAAKKRATKELLAVFGGKGDENLTATSLSLSDTTAAGRALLYASILLQGDLSAGKFGQRLSDAAELFATSGTLDDAETLVAMADWASRADSTDNFAAIRENVKAMKIVETVPDFESALYAFWTKEYGLGKCTDSLESTIEKNENKLSDNYGAGYACTAKRWHKATALDTELGLCTGKMEGSFKEYKGGKSTEYYVCRTGTWQQITETQFELKECTEKRESEYVAAKSGEYFVCTGKQWLELDAVTYELKLCTEKRNMEIATTKKSGSYVCEWDGKKGSWREASDIEAELGVCGSKDVATGSIHRTNSDDYYLCASGKWEKSDKLSYELQGAGACTDKNDLDTYETESFGSYVCEWDGEKGSWRKASDLEVELGVCSGKDVADSSIAVTKNGLAYACLNNEWVEVDDLTAVLGYCNTRLKDTVKWTGDFTNGRPDESTEGKYYACNGTEWNETTKIHYLFGATCEVFANRIQTVYDESPELFESYSVDNNLLEDGSVFGSFKMLGRYNAAWNGAIDMAVYNGDTLYQVRCKDNEYSSIASGVAGMRKFCSESNVGERGRARYVGSTKYSNAYYVCYQKGDGTMERQTDGVYEWGQGFVDSRDSSIYRYVIIGEQTWMAENLNYADSVKTPLLKGNSVLNAGSRLYNWKAAKNICPEGWHMPSEEEWTVLQAQELVSAKTLKSISSGWPDSVDDNYENCFATDLFGFSILRTGVIFSSNANDKIIVESYAGFWTSTPYNSGTLMIYFYTRDKSNLLVRSTNGPEAYFSVRCIKDE